jgi:hypothetical protein
MTVTQERDAIGPRNAWRLETPGVEGWSRTARPGHPRKYYMVSADCHVLEGMAVFERVEPQYRERIPRFEERADGAQYLISEGNRPQLVRPPSRGSGPRPVERSEDGMPARSLMEPEDQRRVLSGRSVEQRIADQRADGVDAEIVFPTVGFVPWLLEAMDHAYRAHHLWVRPVLPELPSTYFRRHCFATFQEDHVGLALAEQLDIVENLMWANDYPHHEGTWPHSAEAIERTMGQLSDSSREKILGRNASRVFGLLGSNHE